MPEHEIERIAEKANMIVAGFSYTVTENKTIRVLNLYNPQEACVLQENGEVIETTMDDMKLAMVQGYYLKNREFMEV